MDEKITTWTLPFPAKENLNKVKVSAGTGMAIQRAIAVVNARSDECIDYGLRNLRIRLMLCR